MNNTEILIAIAVVLILVLWYHNTCVPDAVDLKDVQVDTNVDVVVFWTGGYDSTFRLCELLIDEGKTVQPIYIVDETVDGIPGGIRRSWKKEIQTMDRIIAMLHEQYPHTKQLLRPTLYIKNVQLDRETINTMTNLHHLGFVSRPVNQWAYMAQVIRDLGITAEVGLIDEDHPYLRRAIENSIREVAWKDAIKPNCAGMWDNHKFIDRQHLEKYWFNKLNYAQQIAGTPLQPQSWRPETLGRTATTFVIDPEDKSLEIFHNMRFPLYNLRKNDLYNYANIRGYEDILRITWSCWNPTLLGNPCGECEMCRARIV